MPKWFVKCDTDMVGTDMYELIEEETREAAEEVAQDMARENFYSYDWEQMEEDSEEDGIEFVEGEHYDFEVEEYNPKRHNDYLMESDLMEEINDVEQKDGE